jgi:hypothetical protein
MENWKGCVHGSAEEKALLTPEEVTHRFSPLKGYQSIPYNHIYFLLKYLDNQRPGF